MLLGGGVSGRRSEDFITGREHKKKKSAAGKGVSGRRNEDFIAGREHNLFSAGARGVCVCGRKCEDFDTGRWPHSRNNKVGSLGPRGQHRKQNKNKQTIKTQGEVCIASSTCKKDKCDTPSKASEARCTLYRMKVTPQKCKVSKCKDSLPRKNVKFPSTMPPLHQNR